MYTSKKFTENESKVKNLLYSPVEEDRILGFMMLNQVKSLREFSKRLFMDAISDLRTKVNKKFFDAYMVNKNFFFLKFSNKHYTYMNSWKGRLTLGFEDSFTSSSIDSDYWVGEPNQEVIRVMLLSILNKTTLPHYLPSMIEDKLYKNYHKYTKT